MINLKVVSNAKETFCLNSHITIIDDKVVVVENCKQILECNEILAKVLTHKFEIEIWGENLTLSNFCTESVEVRGKIKSINLNNKSSKEKDL